MPSIFLITGPPASGKTTIARRLAEQFPASIHIQVDRLREMMVNGVALPGQAWNDEATRQFQWARTSAIHMAQVYASNGVDVVIDDVSVPAEFASDYAALFSQPNVRRVLLLPTAAALIARMQKRNGPFDKYLVDAVPWLYSFLKPMDKTGWIVLDNGDCTVEDTLADLLKQV